MLASSLFLRRAYINSVFQVQAALAKYIQVLRRLCHDNESMMKSLHTDLCWTLLLVDLQHFTFDAVAITALIISRVTTSDRMSYETLVFMGRASRRGQTS